MVDYVKYEQINKIINVIFKHCRLFTDILTPRTHLFDNVFYYYFTSDLKHFLIIINSLDLE